MRNFFLGVYLSGVLVTFIFTGFLCVLGGREQDLWKPFVYSVLWPLVLPVLVVG